MEKNTASKNAGARKCGMGEFFISINGLPFKKTGKRFRSAAKKMPRRPPDLFDDLALAVDHLTAVINVLIFIIF